MKSSLRSKKRIRRIFREEEAANVKAATTKQEATSQEAKPTFGDANETLQALKDKMEGK